MLPELSLDLENFEEIVLEYRNRIASIYPEWTDYNYHDPGITLIELFAWLKEIQQFHLDQIGACHRQMYLNLLGVPIVHKTPATGWVEVKCSENQFLLQGTKFYAGSICFESAESEMLLKNDIISCITRDQGGSDRIDENQLVQGKDLRIYPFGKEPEPDNCCYLQLAVPLPVNERIHLSVRIFDRYPVKRVPVRQEEDFFPLGTIAYEAFCDGEWVPWKLIKDETYQLIQDGQLIFSVESLMKQTEVEGIKGYYLRLRLLESQYETPPLITEISFNQVVVVQKDSICSYEEYSIDFYSGYSQFIHVNKAWEQSGREALYYRSVDRFYPVERYEKHVSNGRVSYEIQQPDNWNPSILRILYFPADFEQRRFLGEGTGFPNQQFFLGEKESYGEDLELLIEDAEEAGTYLAWKRVEHFYHSTPTDRHFQFIEKEEMIAFGDGICGMAPEGGIYILRYTSSFGSGGNVKAGRINRVLAHPELTVFNGRETYGGMDEEEFAQSFLRVRQMLTKQERGVTQEDYEALVYRVPGLMIASCKAVVLSPQMDTKVKPRETVMGIMVKPFAGTGVRELSRAYRHNIMRYLDSRRLLGTKVLIYPPEYIHVTVRGELLIKPQYRQAQEMVTQAVETFFGELGETFGRPILYGKLYGMIDSIPCVSGIQNMVIECRGNHGKRNQNGDVIPSYNGVFLLDDVEFIMSVR